MNTAEQAGKAAAFRALHAGPRALVMANAWDAMTARMFEAEGFPAIATTSGGVAGALGFRDGEGAPWDEVVGQTMRIARAVSVPVTADIEGGFGATPRAVGRSITDILGAGAVGVNLEDSIPGQGAMRTMEDAVARIQAARAAGHVSGVPIVINARVDLFIRHVGEGEAQLNEAIERGRAYLAAGADSIYPIGLRDEPTIKRLADALQCPININVRAGHPTVAALEALGVRRITTATSLTMLALTVVRDAVRDIRANGRFDTISPGVTGADMAQLWAKK
jgi:2-methylisocitrate lyase-like PEP mutase family enzyme